LYDFEKPIQFGPEYAAHLPTVLPENDKSFAVQAERLAAVHANIGALSEPA